MVKKPVINSESWFTLFILFLTLLVFPGCATLDPGKISYNHRKQLYEYPLPVIKPVILRTDSSKLVTEDNYNHFISELSLRSFKYPFETRIEIANSLKESDYRLAALYGDIVDKINEEDFNNALLKAKELRLAYPPSEKFTDVWFLEGFAHENNDNYIEAEKSFRNFLTFSSQKYSGRFREYTYADKNDEVWIRQRNYAALYLSENELPPVDGFFQPLIPKYYHINLQPGYTFSDEGLEEHRRGIFSLSAGRDFNSDISLGAQYYRNLTRGLDINPVFYISKSISEFNLALPIQVYKSESNRLGLKLSPFINYMYIKRYPSVYPDNKLNTSVFNFGMKASAGYYLFQKLSIGGYYKHHFYNEKHPLILSEESVKIAWKNEYDVSMYYNLIKGLSLKSGVKSNNWVIGFFMTGLEISYNVHQRNFIFRTELY
jgi:hypothetical protein